MEAKMSVLGLLPSSYSYLRSALVQLPLPPNIGQARFENIKRNPILDFINTDEKASQNVLEK